MMGPVEEDGDSYPDQHGGTSTPDAAPRDSSLMEEASAKSHRGTARWAGIVRRIQQGDASGMEELYQLFSRGIRFYLCRQLGSQELDDRFHDIFLIVLQAIQKGELREPERLMGFVRTVVRRQVAAHIDQAVQTRRDQTDIDNGLPVADPHLGAEEQVLFRERVAIMKQVLSEISQRDREILTRFYLYEQTQEQICADMNLSETQFRLLKSRAKARFGELGRKRMNRRGLPDFLVRKFGS